MKQFIPLGTKKLETGILQAVRLVRIRGGINKIALEVSFLVDITF